MTLKKILVLLAAPAASGSAGATVFGGIIQASGLNLNNNHYLLDNSNTFGGTHYVNPREVMLEVRYRFKY